MRRTKYFLVFILSISFCENVFSQKESPKNVSWEGLKDVKFTQKFSKEYEVEFDYPTFGESVKKLESQVVQIKGYSIPLDPQTYILSALPMAACFFCGGAGPESVIQLNFQSLPDIHVDQIITVRGTFKLNYDNLQELNYILEDVSLLE